MTSPDSPSSKPAADRPFRELAAQFDYERSPRLPVEMTGIEPRDGVTLHDVSYAGVGNQRRILTYLIQPTGEGPFPAVIYVHPAPGSRETFLEEALQLGREGVASLLIQAPWAEGQAWASTLTTPQYTREVYTTFVKDLRRGVDFLQTRPEIDGARLAYVGHSFGALFGGVLAGVEKRLVAFVLMAGVPSFTDVAQVNMPGLKGEALELYAQAMGPIDPLHYVRHAAPASLFFQFGRKDEAFTAEQFERLAQAAGEPRRVEWYDAGHFFENGAGRQDRLEWLKAQLSGPAGA